MNGKEYVTTQIQILQLGQAIQKLDLEAFQKCIINAKQGALSLEPALKERADSSLNQMARLAEAFQTAKNEYKIIQVAAAAQTLKVLGRGKI